MNEQPHVLTPGDGASRAAAPDHPLIPAGRVSGTDIYSPSGEKLGKLEDVALDKVGGEVAYAILSFGGFLGLGSEHHPIPWRLLRYDTERGGYVIPCEKGDLETAPTIRRDELSGWDDAADRDRIHRFYGAYPM